jgi:hypothetical protein
MVKVPEKVMLEKMKRQRLIFKNFSRSFQEITLVQQQNNKTIILYFQDEGRFGLIFKNDRMLAAKEIKPICPFNRCFNLFFYFVLKQMQDFFLMNLFIQPIK